MFFENLKQVAWGGGDWKITGYRHKDITEEEPMFILIATKEGEPDVEHECTELAAQVTGAILAGQGYDVDWFRK